MGLFSKDIGIDLGTANTLVFMKGKGIVMREPSVVAVDVRTDTVLAVGAAAKEMIGRTPGSIVAVRPLKDGVIADFDITATMLKHFIRQTVKPSIFSKPKVIVCIPSGVTDVERRAVEDTARQAGAGDVKLIEEPMAAAIGQATNRKLMRDLRVYMAVGGMPQAVEAYVEGKNFSEIDMVKRQIISLYEDDFKKIDASGRISALYHAIPAQLSKDSRKYRITSAIGKKNNTRAEELLYELIDSKTILPCYNSTDPRVSMADTKDFDSYKLYLADTGLFVTLMFIDRPVTENDVYAKLLSDKLPANLGFLYENLVAQMISASGRELYYHTWEKAGSTHYYEVDFLISEGSKVNAFEIKSSGSGKHESIKAFYKKFSNNVHDIYLLSQKDAGKDENLLLKPFYLMPFLIRHKSDFKY